MNEQVTAGAESQAVGNSNNEQVTNENKVGVIDYSVFEAVKRESIDRKNKINEMKAERSELEAKLKSYEDMINKEKEAKLKEKEDYKALIELKEQEINKLKVDYEPTINELAQLRELKSQVEAKEKAKRESLLSGIKTLSETLKNDSYLTIAEALPDNEKLELYLKSISQVEKKNVPIYDSKPVRTPVGETFDVNSIEGLQELYKKDPIKYKEIINSKKGIKK